MSQKTHLKSQEERVKPSFATVKTLIQLAWPERGKLAFAALFMGISALGTAGYAYLLGPVIRYLFLGSIPTHTEKYSEVLKISAKIGSSGPSLIGTAIVTLAFVKGMSYFCHTALAGQANQRILHNLRARLYQGLLEINPLSSIARSKGELNARFTVDLEAVQGAISQGLVAFIRDVLQILALASLAIALDPVLGLIGLTAFPLVAVLIIRIGRRLRKRRLVVHREFGQLATVVDETASGLSVVQSFGAEALMAKRFESRSQKLASATVRAIVIRALSSPINEVLGAMALALTLWYGGGRIQEGILSPEGFISFFSALFLLYQPIKGLGQAQHAVQSGLAALERLDVLKPEAAAIESGDLSVKPGAEIQEVRLEQVEAGYDGDKSVLKNLNLTIEANSKIAVVGRSGAGKSTLLNTLQGFVSLRKGKFTVDDREIQPNPKVVKHLFALVAQEPFLFNDTIRMNVLCGRPGSTSKEVEEVCEAAGVTSFTKEMEGGLDSTVGSLGQNLSVGQRQRVCLARAILARSPYLLLDEFTASLDGETEQELVLGLDKFLKGRAVVVVTHRLATARWADRVVLLEDGQIQELGSESLLETNERFNQLFGTQRTD